MTTKEDVPLDSNSNSFGFYPTGKTYLFFIAIDHYLNDVPRLNNAVHDAKTVAEYLIEYYQLDRANLKMLTNEKATAEVIITSFKEYINKITNQDNFIFFFSGHGSYDPISKEGFWLTIDAESGKESTFFSNQKVINFIRQLKARHVFGIVDACFSEALFMTRSEVNHIDRRYNIPSRWLLTAGRLEPVSDGSLGDHSPFAKALLSQLEHHGSTRLWVGDLCRSVVNGVIKNTEKQLPRGQALSITGDQGGEFVFLRKGAALPPITETEPILTSPQKGQIINNENKLIIPPVPPDNSLEEKINDVKDRLADQLEENELKLVFNQLKGLLPKQGRKRQLLRQLSTRYNQIIEADMQGAQSADQIVVRLNKLQADLYYFIGDLQEKDIE